MGKTGVFVPLCRQGDEVWSAKRSCLVERVRGEQGQRTGPRFSVA